MSRNDVGMRGILSFMLFFHVSHVTVYVHTQTHAKAHPLTSSITHRLSSSQQYKHDNTLHINISKHLRKNHNIVSSHDVRYFHFLWQHV